MPPCTIPSRSSRAATPRSRRRSTVPCSSTPARIRASTWSRVWLSSTTVSMPARSSSRASVSPAGPAPTMPTCVLTSGPLEREGMRSALDGDPAELGELVDDGLPAEAAPARVLDAAERHLRLVADRLVVDVDDAGLEPLREREALVRIARDDPRAEAVRGRVRALDRLVAVADDLDGEHGAERLLSRELRVRGHVREQRRLEARTDRLAAGEHARAFRDGVVD